MSAEHKAANRSKARDSRFELLRIFAMLLIVLCHVVAFNGWHLEEVAGLRGTLALGLDQYAGQIGVSLFFMLSGYFLVGQRFHFWHVGKTLIQTFLYSVACFAIVICAVRRPLEVHTHDLYNTLLPVLNNMYWFVTAYVFMLLFSPFLNTLFQHMSRNQMLGLIALFVSLSIIPYMSFIGFAYNGMQWTTIMYAACCYCVGGWIRLYGDEVGASWVRVRWLVIYAPIGFTLLTIFLHASRQQWHVARFFSWHERSMYGSFPLFAMMFSAYLLLLVAHHVAKHSDRSTATSNSIINALAASTFGVYLIHQNPYFSNEVIWPTLSALTPRPQGFAAILMTLGLQTILLFAICAFAAILFDYAVVKPIQKVIRHLLRS